MREKEVEVMATKKSSNSSGKKSGTSKKPTATKKPTKANDVMPRSLYIKGLDPQGDY